MLNRTSVVAIGLALLPAPALSQIFGPNDIVDRVIAVVGDSAVLQSQIQEEMQRMRLGGATVPEPTDPQFQTAFREVLDAWIDRLLVVQAAAKDSLIRADPETISLRVNDQLDRLTQQFGGQVALQQALAEQGMTLAGYREMLQHQIRQEQIQQLFIQSRLRNATPADVSEEEMLERFRDASAQLEQRPRLITFRQVVVAPEADESARATAREKADSLLARVRAGEDFAELARENSDDVGSAPTGGDLGWFRRGRMVREFEDAAFGLQAGQVSALVESDFGFHIIKVERARPGERQARHILVMPEVGESDLGRAEASAEAVADRARAGESMSDLYDELSDEFAPDSLTVPFDQLSQLPPAYAVLRSATAGDLVGPLRFDSGSGEARNVRFAVVQVIEVREAGAYTFDDVRGQLASQIQQEKQLERILSRLRENTHIEIRM